MLNEIIKAIEQVDNERRGSGRTTRMMEHAIAQARNGQTVLVLVHHYSRLGEQLRRALPPDVVERITICRTGDDVRHLSHDLMLEDHHSQFIRALEAVRNLPRADNRQRVPGEGLDDMFEPEHRAMNPASVARPSPPW